MKIGAVILSRYNSRRLPGKALLEIEGKTILQYIVERVGQVFKPEQLVVATSTETTDDPIATYCQVNGIQCYRGDLDNVSRRFYEAARHYGWDVATRINGDNVFVDTELLRSMLNQMQTYHYNFLSNVKGRSYPKGMSIEMVDLNHYAQLLPTIEANPDYIEHVTLALYERQSDNYHFVYNEVLPEAAGIQLALDTPEDFARTEALIRSFERPHYTYGLIDLYSLLLTT
ncbi:MAG: hypothetical protein D6772_00310 [Bacteroidetes bacterium]|nr:MAG: hypothetical protein D6772_00310 [Bacteroidota bacterium]